MDTQIIAKLVNKKWFTDKDLKVILYDMCDEVHDSCDSSCIIYQRILTLEQRRTSGGIGGGGSCPYFKKGAKMLAVLRLAGELQDLLISRRERRKER